MDTKFIQCPYCGQFLEIAIDRSIRLQEYIEDCQICCRPMVLTVTIDPDNRNETIVQARSESE